tara:strand:+ start:26 stop:403 length:378 start_codon:yes stop_codon:yes gene_type:complete
MELPKVNIAVIGIICSSLGGMVWYASEQASIIANLEETVAILDAQSNTSDKVNMQRDILANSDRLDDIEDDLEEIWEETEMIWSDVGGMADHMMQIIKLQSRIAILERTLEFINRDHKDMLDPRH